MATTPAVSRKFVVFDIAIIDLTEKLANPVEVLFGLQSSGGADINRSVPDVRDLVTRPAQTHFITIIDLYEGGNREEMLSCAEEAVQAGINVIVLPALSDDGRCSIDTQAAHHSASLGRPVLACMPDQFPEIIGVALQRATSTLGRRAGNFLRAGRARTAGAHRCSGSTAVAAMLTVPCWRCTKATVPGTCHSTGTGPSQSVSRPFQSF
jgi:VWA domain containing CoxE-like protein